MILSGFSFVLFASWWLENLRTKWAARKERNAHAKEGRDRAKALAEGKSAPVSGPVIKDAAPPAPTARPNFFKKEKKRNKPSRKKMAKPATVHVEPDIIMAGQQNECVEQSADNKLNKKRKGEGRKHRKLSEEALQKDALSTAQQPESGSTVRLKTPADARRAFIYSEIFNRKY